MATSGTAAYTQTQVEIIKQASYKAGISARGVAPTGAQAAEAERELNTMLKAWQAEPGVNLWLRTEGEIDIVADQISYTLGGSGSPDFSVRPVRVEQMNFQYSDGRELPMHQMAYQEYFELPQKDSTGPATSYFYDPQIPAANLKLWPVPGPAYAGSKLVMLYWRRIEDILENDENFDFPPEWEDAITFGLAYRLCGNAYGYESGRARALEEQAKIAYNIVANSGYEEGSIFIQPALEGRY